MTEKSKSDRLDAHSDAFWRNEVYTDAAATLAFTHLPTNAIKNDCIVVIDANVLLQPYEVDSKEAVNEIERVYRKLSTENRLIVPGQSVREYQTHRPHKLAAVVSKLTGAIERLRKVTIDRIPLLENEPDFAAIRAALKLGRENIETAISGLQNQIDKLGADTGADPIATLYREVLAKCVVDTVFSDEDRKEIVDDMNRRVRLKIAPGFKDEGKDDLGVGDLIIWRTAISEGKKRGQNCIFVTMETKPDWWVKQNGAFLPRPELVEEYRRETNGMSVRLMPLSQLLGLFAAPENVVTEVKQAEVLANYKPEEVVEDLIGRSSIDKLIADGQISAERLQDKIGRKQSMLARQHRKLAEAERGGLRDIAVYAEMERLTRDINALQAQESMLAQELAQLAWTRSVDRLKIRRDE